MSQLQPKIHHFALVVPRMNGQYFMPPASDIFDSSLSSHQILFFYLSSVQRLASITIVRPGSERSNAELPCSQMFTNHLRRRLPLDYVFMSLTRQFVDCNAAVEKAQDATALARVLQSYFAVRPPPTGPNPPFVFDLGSKSMSKTSWSSSIRCATLLVLNARSMLARPLDPFDKVRDGTGAC